MNRATQALTLLLLSCLFYSSHAIPPSKTNNPFIQSGHYASIINNLGVSNYSWSINYVSSTQIFRYQYTFPSSFTNLPVVGLGIWHLEVDPRYYDTGQEFFKLKVDYPTIVRLYVTLETTYPLSFMKTMKFFYFAADITQANQIVAIKHVSTTNSYLQQYQDGMNLWRYDNLTVSFLQTVVKWGRVRYVASIVGQKFLQRNYTMISVLASSINSSEFQVRIGVHGYARLAEVSVYVIAIDLFVAQNKLHYYQYQNIQYTKNSTHLLDNFSSVNENRKFISYNYLASQNTSGDKVYFQFNWSYDNGIVNMRNTNLRLGVLEPFIYDCPTMGYYFDPLTKQCLNSCTRFSNNPYQDICNTCTKYCTSCSAPTVCNYCISTRRPDHNNYNCICQVSYYEKYEQFCQLCSIPILGCNTCTNYTNCSTCDTSRGFDSVPFDNVTCQCQPLRTYIADVQRCVCDDGYYDAAGSCWPCHYSCILCDESGEFHCTKCDPYVYRVPINGACQCNTDLGFKELCSTVEPDCDPSICYLDPSISLTLSFDPSNIVKDPDSNTLIYTINISPVLQFMNYIHFNQAVDLGFGAAATFTSKYQDGLLTLHVTYTENLQGNSTQFVFSLFSSSPSFAKVPNYTLQHSIFPSNNLAANVYTESEYLLRDIFKYSTMVLVGLAFAIFAVGAYSSKVIVTEMMGIVQTSFLGLLLFDFHDPMINSLAFLKYSNGFNDIMPNPKDSIPNRIYLMGYSQLVTNNLNTAGMIIALPFLFGIVLLVISQIKRKGKLTLISYFKLCMGEWTMFLVLFSLCNLSASTALFASHVTVRDWRFILSIVQISVIFVFVIANLLLYGFTDYNYFGEFKCMFKWDKFQLNYYYFHAFIRLFAGMAIGFFNYTYYSAASISGVFFVIALVTIIKRPYSDNLHSIRSSVNLILGSVIFMLYTLASFKGSTNGNNFYSRIPIFILSLLYVVVFMSIGFTARQFVMANKVQTTSQQQPSDQLAVQKQIHDEMMKKKIEEEIKKSEGENSFAKKLFLAKHKKPKRKRKRSHFIIDDFDIQDGSGMRGDMEMNNLDPKGQEGGLTLARIKMVDSMLKEGLL